MSTPTGFKQRLGAELAAMEQARAEQSATAEAAPARRWTPGRRLTLGVAVAAAAGIAAVALPALGSHPAAEAQAYSLAHEKDGSYVIHLFDKKGLPQAVKALRERGVDVVLETAMPKDKCHEATPPIKGPGLDSPAFSMGVQAHRTVVYWVHPNAIPKGQTLVLAMLPPSAHGFHKNLVLASVYKDVPSCYFYEVVNKRTAHSIVLGAGVLS